MEDMVRFLFTFAFTQGIEDILDEADTIGYLLQGLFNVISNSLVAIGISLVALFWIIELLSKLINYQERNFSWEHLTLMIVKLIFAKNIVQHSGKILDGIKNIGELINNTIGTASGVEWAEDIMSLLDDIISGAGMLQKVQILFTLLIFGVIGCGVTFFIKIVLFGRMFEIAIYSAVSPLPLSTITFDSLKNTGVGFIKNYLAVIIQGGLIVLIVTIGGSIKLNEIIGLGESDFMSYLISLLLVDILTVVTIFKSGSWSSKIIGAN